MAKRKTILAALLAATFAIDPVLAETPAPLPHLERRGSATQLIVDGKPFLILGGETHNSSFSNTAYMKPIWPKLAAMHLNTVLMPVAWENMEPQEGRYDFTLVDDMLKGARANNLRIVILWFGSWKNTYSSYVPDWVKKDTSRFARVETSDGRSTERLSPFSSVGADADAKAFGKLMRHLREVDGDRHTVLFVQVENEVGVLPQSRDHSAVAEAAFTAPVPGELMQYLADHRTKLEPNLRATWEAAGAKTSGSWQQVFGDGSLTDHLFMSWFYATYVQKVAAAGEAQYALPLYTNAALIRPNYEPGQYNSGGPLPQSIDLWKAGAPTLNFFSPDIYFNDFVFWASAYKRPDNPLFIPEARGGAEGAANALYAFGALDAIGVSPFGIDGITGLGDQDGNGRSNGGTDDAIGNVFGQLSPLSSLILQKQAEGKIRAFVMEGEPQRAGRVRIGDYIANITRVTAGDTASRVSAMFLEMSPDEFIVIGSGDAQLTFTTDRPGAPTVGIASIDEEYPQPSGGMIAGRRLNGDENGQGQVLRLNASDAAQGKVYRVRLYRYR